jgi:hypothetical protein
MLYLGSDMPLPTSEWKKESPAFFLSETDGNIKKAKRHFTKPNVYYAGSYEGCGCGFFFSEFNDPEDYDIRKNTARGLVNMIERSLLSSHSAELLVTWAGCEKKKPKRRLEMNPQELLGEEFPLEEQDFVVFKKKT